MLVITPISDLNPDQIPVTLKAEVKSVYPAPQKLVSQEGRLKDESGEVAFTVWKDSGAADLKAGRSYIFYRVGLGKRDRRLEVRVCAGCRVFPVKNEKVVRRVLAKISRLEQAERARLTRGARHTSRLTSPSRKGVYSILITAGLFLWVLGMILHFTGVLTEEKLKSFFRGKPVSPENQAVASAQKGRVEEVIDGGAIAGQVEGERWLVRYLGLEAPAPPAREGAKIDPWALRALNYNRYLVGGKTVRLEFEKWQLPRGKEVRAYVFLDQELINAALLEKGLARLSYTPRKLRYAGILEQAESSARKARRGIWGRVDK
jgi:endonuclease YncB( thermonuclease family)